MNLKTKKTLRQATLCLLIKDNQILLAMKKRGFGQGKWNGVGGKPNPKENIEQTAIRETQEEIGIIPKSLKRVALNFYFRDQMTIGARKKADHSENPASPYTKRLHFPEDLAKQDWNQQVCVFLVNEWEGEPVETEEMAPCWFKYSEIPFEQMWSDDIHWLPKVLEGKFLNADFTFDENQNLQNFEIAEGVY